MENKFNKSKYDNDFAKDNYDRIPLQVPKGYKKVILNHAKSEGFNSINSYIKNLLEKNMNIDFTKSPEE